MELGYASMNTPADVPPSTIGQHLESVGFTSLWMGEHPQIPVQRSTPYPAGGEMPTQYRAMMDPLVSLAAAAQATTTLRLATGVCLPLEHDLFALAKAVSTLDVLSGGRVDFGVGVGWNQEELANVRPDISWTNRYIALAEAVAALRVLWTADEPVFDGRWYSFDATWCDPKPVQKPHPPVIVGAAGRIGTAQAARWGDEWAPMDIGLGDVSRRVATFRQAVGDNDRSDVPITLFTWGDPTPDTLRQYRDLGIKQAVLGASRIDWDKPETTLAFIDRYAVMVDELR